MTLTTPARDTSPASETARLQLKGIDHIELYVGNPFQAAHFYRTAFGWRILASRPTPATAPPSWSSKAAYGWP
jgi:hypothetical protein